MTAASKPVLPGHAAEGVATPVTPRNVPYQGGPANPSAAALQHEFGAAIQRVDVNWGETTVYVDRAKVRDVIAWLKEDQQQRYDYLSDVTAVEYRDVERALEVVWHLRSLPYRRFLRVKVALQKGTPLAVPSVIQLYAGADWLERRQRLHRRDVAAFVRDERHALGTSLGIEPGRGQRDINGAFLGHYSPVRSPVSIRLRMSSGRSSNASAIESSSIE